MHAWILTHFISLIIIQERRRPQTGGAAVLESGTFSGAPSVAHSQMKPKVDEDGDSYWVFESRDVGLLRFLRDIRDLDNGPSLLVLQTLWTQSGFLTLSVRMLMSIPPTRMFWVCSHATNIPCSATEPGVFF